jgi:hypothetical protein
VAVPPSARGEAGRAAAARGPGSTAADVLTTADAPGLPGDAVEFAAFPGGDLVLDGDVGAPTSPLLAEAPADRGRAVLAQGGEPVP